MAEMSGDGNERRSRGQWSDAELMARMQGGDAGPLAELYRRYGRMVFSVVQRFTGVGDRAELEDLVQEVFLTLFETASHYQETGRLRSWLCGIAVRKARGGRRRRWLRDALFRRFAGRTTGTAMEHASSVESDVSARVEVQRALAVLPEAQREVLLLHVVESLSGEEIAEALGISPKTVWTRLHRARLAMRQAVKSRRDGGSGGER
jgi:RNA polymerase sigma-70 factor (ECF subfamily)